MFVVYANKHTGGWQLKFYYQSFYMLRSNDYQVGTKSPDDISEQSPIKMTKRAMNKGYRDTAFKCDSADFYSPVWMDYGWWLKVIVSINFAVRRSNQWNLSSGWEWLMPNYIFSSIDSETIGEQLILSKHRALLFKNRLIYEMSTTVTCQCDRWSESANASGTYYVSIKC